MKLNVVMKLFGFLFKFTLHHLYISIYHVSFIIKVILNLVLSVCILNSCMDWISTIFVCCNIWHSWNNLVYYLPFLVHCRV